jgi:hypothetical protein
MVSIKSGLGSLCDSSASVRKCGMGKRSTGGFARKRNPSGVRVAFAKDSNCLSVGSLLPVSHWLNFGNFLRRMSALKPERFTAQCRTSLLMATLFMIFPIVYNTIMRKGAEG